MKIQSEFDKKIKEVYQIIALPYPPKSLLNNAHSEEHFDPDDYTTELKPFKLKSQSFNIQKDELTVHKTSKQLTNFLSECERKRRDEDDSVDQNFLKYKEDVVHFIESLSSKAKAEKAHNDSLSSASLKEKKVDILCDVRRSSNAIQADKEVYDEQQRRIQMSHDEDGQEATLEHVNKLLPIHENLISVFRKNTIESKIPIQSSLDTQNANDVTKKMKNLLNSAKLSDQEDIPPQLDVIPGSGQIGKAHKRGNASFQSNLTQVAEGAKRKSTVHAELITNVLQKTGIAEQAEASAEKENKDKLNVVLEAVVHKVTGKIVEKEVEEEVAREELTLARRDTMEKIKDYGMRKEVLENADTSYLTETEHDESSKKGKEAVLEKIVQFEKLSTTSLRKAPNPVIVKLAKRRPTGPPNPVGFGQTAGAKKVRLPAQRNLTKVTESGAKGKVSFADTNRKGSATQGSAPDRKSSITPSSGNERRKSSTTPSPNPGRTSVVSSNTGTRKTSLGMSANTGDRKPSVNSSARRTSTPPVSAGARKTSAPGVSPNTGARKTSAPGVSPNTGARKTSAPGISPNTGARKTSAQTSASVSSARKVSGTGATENPRDRKPSAGAAGQKPNTGQRWN